MKREREESTINGDDMSTGAVNNNNNNNNTPLNAANTNSTTTTATGTTGTANSAATTTTHNIVGIVIDHKSKTVQDVSHLFRVFTVEHCIRVELNAVSREWNSVIDNELANTRLFDNCEGKCVVLGYIGLPTTNGTLANSDIDFLNDCLQHLQSSVQRYSTRPLYGVLVCTNSPSPSVTHTRRIEKLLASKMQGGYWCVSDAPPRTKEAFQQILSLIYPQNKLVPNLSLITNTVTTPATSANATTTTTTTTTAPPQSNIPNKQQQQQPYNNQQQSGYTITKLSTSTSSVPTTTTSSTPNSTSATTTTSNNVNTNQTLGNKSSTTTTTASNNIVNRNNNNLNGSVERSDRYQFYNNKESVDRILNRFDDQFYKDDHLYNKYNGFRNGSNNNSNNNNNNSNNSLDFYNNYNTQNYSIDLRAFKNVPLVDRNEHRELNISINSDSDQSSSGLDSYDMASSSPMQSPSINDIIPKRNNLVDYCYSTDKLYIVPTPQQLQQQQQLTSPPSPPMSNVPSPSTPNTTTTTTTTLGNNGSGGINNIIQNGINGNSSAKQKMFDDIPYMKRSTLNDQPNYLKNNSLTSIEDIDTALEEIESQKESSRNLKRHQEETDSEISSDDSSTIRQSKKQEHEQDMDPPSDESNRRTLIPSLRSLDHLTKRLLYSNYSDRRSQQSTLAMPNFKMKSVPSSAQNDSHHQPMQSIGLYLGESVVDVMVVEDNEMNAGFLLKLLEKFGVYTKRCIWVTDGVQAVQAYKTSTQPFRLILMDLFMPHMDGYQATNIIRQLEGESKHTPIVTVTANVTKGAKEKCLSSGFDGYIAKPIRAEELKYVVDRYVHQLNIL